MRKFKVIVWFIPLILLIFVEAIAKAIGNVILVIFYPILKKHWKFHYWCEDWKEYKMADWITETWELYW